MNVQQRNFQETPQKGDEEEFLRYFGGYLRKEGDELVVNTNLVGKNLDEVIKKLKEEKNKNFLINEVFKNNYDEFIRDLENIRGKLDELGINGLYALSFASMVLNYIKFAQNPYKKRRDFYIYDVGAPNSVRKTFKNAFNMDYGLGAYNNAMSNIYQKIKNLLEDKLEYALAGISLINQEINGDYFDENVLDLIHSQTIGAYSLISEYEIINKKIENYINGIKTVREDANKNLPLKKSYGQIESALHSYIVGLLASFNYYVDAYIYPDNIERNMKVAEIYEKTLDLPTFEEIYDDFNKGLKRLDNLNNNLIQNIDLLYSKEGLNILRNILIRMFKESIKNAGGIYDGKEIEMLVENVIQIIKNDGDLKNLIEEYKECIEKGDMEKLQSIVMEFNKTQGIKALAFLQNMLNIYILDAKYDENSFIPITEKEEQLYKRFLENIKVLKQNALHYLLGGRYDEVARAVYSLNIASNLFDVINTYSLPYQDETIKNERNFYFRDTYDVLDKLLPTVIKYKTIRGVLGKDINFNEEQRKFLDSIINGDVDITNYINGAKTNLENYLKWLSGHLQVIGIMEKSETLKNIYFKLSNAYLTAWKLVRGEIEEEDLEDSVKEIEEAFSYVLNPPDNLSEEERKAIEEVRKSLFAPNWVKNIEGMERVLKYIDYASWGLLAFGLVGGAVKGAVTTSTRAGFRYALGKLSKYFLEKATSAALRITFATSLARAGVSSYAMAREGISEEGMLELGVSLGGAFLAFGAMKPAVLKNLFIGYSYTFMSLGFAGYQVKYYSDLVRKKGLSNLNGEEWASLGMDILFAAFYLAHLPTRLTIRGYAYKSRKGISNLARALFSPIEALINEIPKIPNLALQTTGEVGEGTNTQRFKNNNKHILYMEQVNTRGESSSLKNLKNDPHQKEYGYFIRRLLHVENAPRNRYRLIPRVLDRLFNIHTYKGYVPKLENNLPTELSRPAISSYNDYFSGRGEKSEYLFHLKREGKIRIREKGGDKGIKIYKKVYLLERSMLKYLGLKEDEINKIINIRENIRKDLSRYRKVERKVNNWLSEIKEIMLKDSNYSEEGINLNESGVDKYNNLKEAVEGYIRGEKSIEDIKKALKKIEEDGNIISKMKMKSVQLKFSNLFLFEGLTPIKRARKLYESIKENLNNLNKSLENLKNKTSGKNVDYIIIAENLDDIFSFREDQIENLPEGIKKYLKELPIIKMEQKKKIRNIRDEFVEYSLKAAYMIEDVKKILKDSNIKDSNIYVDLSEFIKNPSEENLQILKQKIKESKIGEEKKKIIYAYLEGYIKNIEKARERLKQLEKAIEESGLSEEELNNALVRRREVYAKIAKLEIADLFSPKFQYGLILTSLTNIGKTLMIVASLSLLFPISSETREKLFFEGVKYTIPRTTLLFYYSIGRYFLRKDSNGPSSTTERSSEGIPNGVKQKSTTNLTNSQNMAPDKTNLDKKNDLNLTKHEGDEKSPKKGDRDGENPDVSQDYEGVTLDN